MKERDAWSEVALHELICEETRRSLKQTYNQMVDGGKNEREIHEEILKQIERDRETIEKHGIKMPSLAYALQLILKREKENDEIRYEPDWINN